MKTHTRVTRDEEMFTCDYCGTLIQFPTKTCFSCGKDACNGSCHLKLAEYPGGSPAELDIVRHKHGTGVTLPLIFFCEECDKVEPLAKVLREIKSLELELVEAFAKYRRSHYALALKAERMIEKKAK